MDRLILEQHLAPGDTVVLTALARDLALAYPQLTLGVDTKISALWGNNPHVKAAARGLNWPDTRKVHVDYGAGIRRQNHETVHFLTWLYRDARTKLGLDIPIRVPRGDIHLSEAEKTPLPGLPSRYWVLVAGGKTDVPVKVWEAARWQKVVHLLAEHDIPVVQAGAVNQGHWQPELQVARDLVGRTTLRNFIQLVAHADGVLCAVSFPMHLAAALEKPCVVLAGGREQWYWEAYVRENHGFEGAEAKLKVPHRYLHTIGLLDCCLNHGCWRELVPRPGTEITRKHCKRPVTRPNQVIPECLALITPEMVVENVLSYYLDGTLGG